MRRSDFHYSLPRSLIAQTPLKQRTSSRLLTLIDGGIEHRKFSNIVDLLEPNDLLVINDTRVIKARVFAVKDSGGRVEILLEQVKENDTAICQVRASKPLQPGRTLSIGDETISVIERVGEFYKLGFPGPVLAFLDARGHIPLPPYVIRHANELDEIRYQTVYGSVPGAVAAPTAGLHFDELLMRRIEAKGVGIAKVTLHVGAGTFQPVRSQELDTHVMHEERYEISPETSEAVNSCRGRVVAVGTTVVRTLESSAAANGNVVAGAGQTALFIIPGYSFKVVNALVTNFHLPESTLIMLVAAFSGYEQVMRAYESAIDNRYRFFSYGDAMFCERHV